ncbi:AMP-binding protein [Spirosoma linguale]|uniref:AMP-binding protein n=1 Tax=Spirosoma linguale TaxID=108 RepID=UPI003CC8025A
MPEDYLTLPLFTLFIRQVRQRPDKLAIWDGVAGYTYHQLGQYSGRIAQTLGQLKHRQQQPIGIWLENDRQFIAVMLAALAVGRPYVAFDVTMPLAYNLALAKQANIGDMISIAAHKADLQTLEAPVLYLDILPEGGSSSCFQPTATGDSLAYIIYTSGTTGTPKGVYQNQRNLLHDVSQYIDSIHLSAHDRLSLLYSPTVNGALRDIFGTLLTGATLYIRNLRHHGLASLAAFITTYQLTIYHSVPSIFRAFLLTAGSQTFPSVRLVYLAGDRIVNQDVESYKRHFLPHAFLYIGIGSTENATIYRQWFVTHTTRIGDEPLPVGYAVADRRMYLQSTDGSPTPLGETGEIVVESAFMALGYWQNPALTQATFTQTESGRQFRTGDLGRIRPDGLLEFIGRKDRQIKVAGHRIELAAVEAVIRQIPWVQDTVVIGRPVASEYVLVAYLVSRTPSPAMDQAALLEYCRARLPVYMVPKHWESIAEIPLLANFKVDLSALRRLDAQRTLQVNASSSVTPANGSAMTTAGIKRVLKEAWCATGAGLPTAYERNESWRSGGGSSLDAVAFLLKLEAALNVQIPSEWIHSQMIPLALEKQLLKRVGLMPEPLVSSVSRPVIYFFSAFDGLGPGSVELLRDLQTWGEVNLISYPDVTALRFFDIDFESYIATLMIQIASLPPAQVIIGVCSGTYPAHEVARRLYQPSGTSPALVLVDYFAPGQQPITKFATQGLVGLWRSIRSKSPYQLLQAFSRRFLPNRVYRQLKQYHQQDPRRAYKVLERTVRLAFLPQQVYLLRMSENHLDADLGWEGYCGALIIKSFSFSHRGMLRDANHRRILVDSLRHIESEHQVSVR